MRYKEGREVFWAQGARRRPLRLIVLAPTPDCKSPNGRTHYRAQAYILTTDLKRRAEVLIQCYLDRCQIEANHREEKSQFGVGDAQPLECAPPARFRGRGLCAFMLLAAQRAYGGARGDPYVPLPRWRTDALRPSCLDFVSRLRREMELRTDKLLDFARRSEVTAAAMFRAAA